MPLRLNFFFDRPLGAAALSLDCAPRLSATDCGEGE